MFIELEEVSAFITIKSITEKREAAYLDFNTLLKTKRMKKLQNWVNNVDNFQIYDVSSYVYDTSANVIFISLNVRQQPTEKQLSEKYV